MHDMLPFNVWRENNSDLEAAVRENLVGDSYNHPECEDCDGTGLKFCYTCEYENECHTCAGKGRRDFKDPEDVDDFVVQELRRLYYIQAGLDATKWKSYQAFIKECYGTLAA